MPRTTKRFQTTIPDGLQPNQTIPDGLRCKPNKTMPRTTKRFQRNASRRSTETLPDGLRSARNPSRLQRFQTVYRQRFHTNQTETMPDGLQNQTTKQTTNDSKRFQTVYRQQQRFQTVYNQITIPDGLPTMPKTIPDGLPTMPDNNDASNRFQTVYDANQTTLPDGLPNASNNPNASRRSTICARNPSRLDFCRLVPDARRLPAEDSRWILSRQLAPRARFHVLFRHPRIKLGADALAACRCTISRRT